MNASHYESASPEMPLHLSDHRSGIHLQAACRDSEFPERANAGTAKCDTAQDANRFVIIGIEDRGTQSFFSRHGGFGSRFAALGVRSPIQNPARSHGQRICGRQESTNQEKGTK
jgi:hypothetical protein